MLCFINILSNIAEVYIIGWEGDLYGKELEIWDIIQIPWQGFCFDPKLKEIIYQNKYVSRIIGKINDQKITLNRCYFFKHNENDEIDKFVDF